MRKEIAKFLLIAGLVACPVLVSAAEFGIIDAAQIFNKYNETQKTKTMQKNKKATLQNELEKRKAEVKELNDKYIQLAKETQKKRDSKAKDVAASEKQMTELRSKLAAKEGELQKFFEESQKNLYALEEKEMGALSKNLDAKVDTVIEKIAKNYKLKAVFERRGVYWQDKTACKDITDEVIKALNSGK